MTAVTDEKDIRVLVPRMRRALDGPQATSSASVSAVLNDTEITGVIADAIAEAIFYTNGAWGRQLVVTERDTNYLAPVAWETDQALTEPEATVVTAQAALNYFHNNLTSMKASEHIVNEGEEWQWSTSAAAIAERIKQLKQMRDEALEAVSSGHVNEDWINTLYVRDSYTDILIEPYITGGMGGMQLDDRFGGLG